MVSPMTRLKLAIFVFMNLTACGGAAPTPLDQSVAQGDLQSALTRYEELRMTQGPDIEALGKVAGLLLEQEALYPGSRRNAALGQLRSSGSAAEPALQRLAQRERSRAAQARALEILALRGDAEAQAKLKGLLSDKDPEATAAALASLDPEDDRVQLVKALRSPHGLIRNAAAQRLGGAEAHPRVRSALVDAARLDPLYTVRAAALKSLTKYGSAAKEALRSGLKDSNSSVRLVAIAGSAQARDDELTAWLTGQLAQPQSTESIEVARALAVHATGKAQSNAKEYLLSALTSQDRQARHQAAVALQTVSRQEKDTAGIAQALDRENETDIKVALATMLVDDPNHASRAKTVLSSVIETDGMASVYAAAYLVKDGGYPQATAALERMMQAGSVEVRAAAARALARDANQPDAARTALKAPHPRVRIEAAGGILAALSAS